MYDEYDELMESCETATKALGMANDKIRKNGGQITAGDAEYLDHLSHIIKSNKTAMAMMDAEDGYSSRGSYEDMTGSRSYARGRGRGAKRDSIGRYSSRMSRRSYDDGMYDEER